MTRHLRLLASAIATALLVVGAVDARPANTQEKSRPPYVTDSASLFSREQTGELNALLSRHNQTGFGYIRLIVVSRLPGDTTIEDYSNALLQEDLAGPEAQLDRALFVVSIENRKLRIEAAPAAQRALSDEFVKQVIDNDIIPRFKQGEFFVGIKAGLVALTEKFVQAAGLAQATQVETPEPGHVEVAIAGSAGAALPAGALEALIILAREQDFLSSSSVATKNPLAPCALLSGAVASDLLNRMFSGISHPGSINFFPPRGTYILGLYDADMARGKGSIPRDDPTKAADILARLIIFQSWKISTILNTLIIPLTQRDCLDLLTSPDKLDRALSNLRPTEAVLSHAAPVAAYIATYRHEDGNVLLAQLLEAGYLDKASSGPANPLSPCALLGAFRLAARLNDAWNNKLTKGVFDATGRPELAPYIEDLKDGKTLKAVTARTAEVMAAVFTAETLRANDLTARLTQDATEGECLDELFEPGTLRRRLMQKGITLPLH